MFEHTIQIRVRYGETDKMGYLYYGNYAMYFEVGRVEAIRSLGISYKEIEDEKGILLPVTQMNSKYFRPAHYDGLLTLKTSVREKPSRFMVFHSEVYNEKNKLLNKTEVTLAFVDTNTRKAISCPDFIEQSLKPYFES